METVTQVLLGEDLYFLTNGEKGLIYSPRRMITFEIFSTNVDDVIAFSKGQEFQNLFTKYPLNENDKLLKNRVGMEYFPTRLILSLTSSCNLRCIYCYASAGSKGKFMPWLYAKIAMDAIAQNLSLKGGDIFKITFHGGGEPLLAFPMMRRCVDYIHQIWEGKTFFSVVTNGTLVTPEIAEWFAENGFRVTLSLDGPADVQNFQRPKANGQGSFEDAITGGKCLQNAGVNFGIRTTVTNTNVFRMPEILMIAQELGCDLKLEPFTPVGRGVDKVELLCLDDFYKGYINLRELAQKNKVRLDSTYYSRFEPKCYYCSGDGEMCCVLPDGKISSCSRVTREEDELADMFLIGKVKESGITIDVEKVSRLRSLNVMCYPQCQNCFAKWYCAGGCHNTRMLNSGEMPDEHCRLVQQFLWTKLLERI